MRLRAVVFGIAGVAIVIGSFFGTLWLMDRLLGPTCPKGIEVAEFKRPFIKGPGSTFYKEGLSVTGDTQTNASKTVLCEGNAVLGPAHAAHADIGKIGMGRYSHWGNTLLFSTSDNSDPNTNARTYTLVTP